MESSWTVLDFEATWRTNYTGLGLGLEDVVLRHIPGFTIHIMVMARRNADMTFLESHDLWGVT